MSRSRSPLLGGTVFTNRARGAATFRPRSENRKLSPVASYAVGGKKRIRAEPPFCSSTYTAIAATCSDSCLYKSNGCYVTEGPTKKLAARLDEASRGFTSEQVIAEEAYLILASFRGGEIPQIGWRGRGLDLRLHVGGDVGSASGARLLACAVDDYFERGGGAVWTFTEAWRRIRREAWGDISVVASVTCAEELELARKRGYPAAIVVDRFPNGTKAFSLPGTSTRVVPCPNESGAGAKRNAGGQIRPLTCVECRLCLNASRLLAASITIAFQTHGPGARKVTEALASLRVSRTGRAAVASQTPEPARGIRALKNSAATRAATTGGQS